MKMLKAKLGKSQKTVSKTGKVSWRPRWSQLNDDGKYKTVYGKSQSLKSEADTFAQDKVNEINDRTFKKLVDIDQVMTVGEFVEKHWIKAERQVLMKNKAMISTAIKYWKKIGLWNEPLDEITSADCYKYIADLRAKGLAPATVQNYKTELRTVLALALTFGQISINPIIGVKNERRTQEQKDREERIFNDIRTKTWTMEEIKTNLEKLKTIPKIAVTQYPKNRSSYTQMRSATGSVPEILWYGRFLLGFYLGLRNGEILSLKFSDFDMDNKEVLINTQMSNHTHIDEFGNIKLRVTQEGQIKASSQRYQHCQDEVIAFVNDVALMQMSLGIYHEDQYLFIDRKGFNIGITYFRDSWIRIQEHCGITNPLRSPKYTRHSSATALAGLGWSAGDIAQHLGHKNDRVTREYYILNDKDRKKKMAQEFGN
jgi:integrase